MVLSYVLISVFVFVMVQLLIEGFNLFAIPTFQQGEGMSVSPKVSVLVPARNEEHNIKKCVQSLLRQDYPNFEVIVLNDNSEDQTLSILTEIQKEYRNLIILNGAKPEPGWLGKHWACHQLSQKASGEWILFTDADTHHAPNMLTAVMKSQEKKPTDLLTAIVKEETGTIGEKLTVPFMAWSIFSLLPVFIGVWLKRPAFSATIGQFMLFKKQSYEKVGGHSAVRGYVVDDLALGRLIMRNGLQWRIYNAKDYVSCRMYHSFREAFNGFGKNYFAIFNYKILVSLFVWVWLMLIAWAPLLTLCIQLQNGAILFHGDWHIDLSLLIVLLQMILWLIPVIKFQLPWMTVLFYPVIIFIASTIGVVSMARAISGKASWKGRMLGAQPIRWI